MQTHATKWNIAITTYNMHTVFSLQTLSSHVLCPVMRRVVSYVLSIKELFFALWIMNMEEGRLRWRGVKIRSDYLWIFLIVRTINHSYLVWHKWKFQNELTSFFQTLVIPQRNVFESWWFYLSRASSRDFVISKLKTMRLTVVRSMYLYYTTRVVDARNKSNWVEGTSSMKFAAIFRAHVISISSIFGFIISKSKKIRLTIGTLCQQ